MQPLVTGVPTRAGRLVLVAELRLVSTAAAISGANGLTDFLAREVSVRMDMDDAAQVKTLAHELGHPDLVEGEVDLDDDTDEKGGPVDPAYKRVKAAVELASRPTPPTSQEEDEVARLGAEALKRVEEEEQAKRLRALKNKGEGVGAR